MQTARHEQHYKILKLYDAPADYRRLKQKVVDTVVSVQNDNRFFAKTEGRWRRDTRITGWWTLW